MKLYSYFRSSASYRVRIALNLKGLSYQTVPVHLLKDGGEQFSPEYRKLNADALVPSLQLPDGNVLTQSLAVMEYLEESYPRPALLPSNAEDRAWVRSIALSIACDIHPIDNLRVLRYLQNEMGVSKNTRIVGIGIGSSRVLRALNVYSPAIPASVNFVSAIPRALLIACSFLRWRTASACSVIYRICRRLCVLIKHACN